MKKALAENFKREPGKCRFNGVVEGNTYRIGVCLYDAETPEDWPGLVCDEKEGGLEQAKKCDWFGPKATKEEVKEEFSNFFKNSSLPEIAQRYPDVAALMWVLDSTTSGLDEDEFEDNMSHLLSPVQLWSKPLPKNAIPVALEFPVGPSTAPYLVTSSTSCVWVPKATQANTVRAAVRTGVKTLGELYKDIVENVARKGAELKWGNVHPNTPKGVLGAVEHIRYYDFDDIEIMAHPDFLESQNAAWEEIDGLANVTRLPVRWLEPGWVVAIPADRSYVGFVSLAGSGSVVSVVHNPSRGIAVARPPEKT